MLTCRIHAFYLVAAYFNLRNTAIQSEFSYHYYYYYRSLCECLRSCNDRSEITLAFIVTIKWLFGGNHVSGSHDDVCGLSRDQWPMGES